MSGQYRFAVKVTTPNDDVITFIMEVRAGNQQAARDTVGFLLTAGPSAFRIYSCDLVA